VDIINSNDIVEKLKNSDFENSLNLFIKDHSNGRTYATLHNYVEDDILFIFTTKELTSPRDYNDFMKNIKDEGEDESLIFALLKALPVGTSMVEFSTELIKEIMEFPLRVYLGDIQDEIIDLFGDEDKVKSVVNLEVIGDTLYLIV